MELRNCSRCGKLFWSMGRRLCPDCVAQEEKEFEKVRRYVREHRDATITRVSEVTGVPADRINQYIREGRLELAGVTLECMGCGAPIARGRFCEECLARMSERATAEGKEKTSEGQRKLERRSDSRTAPRFYSLKEYLEQRRKE